MSRTMNTKSVSAGEWAAPAHGPSSTLICGITPDALTVRRKIPPYPASALTPSWIRAPAPSERDTSGAPHGLGEVHQLVDLRRVRLAERAAEDPEVVRVDENAPAEDLAPAGDHAVGAGAPVLEAEPGGAVPPQLVDLVERALVEEQVDPFPDGELALGVLPLGRAPGR